MIRNDLKGFAQQRGLSVTKELAYGDLRGYAATLYDDNSGRRLILSTRLSPSAQQGLRELLANKETCSAYGIQRSEVSEQTLAFLFKSGRKSVERMGAFVDWLPPILDGYQAATIHTCPLCSLPQERGKWILYRGTALCVHSGCAQRLSMQLEAQREEERPGSYLQGFLGALLGAAVGSLVWALILGLGYVSAAGGLLIGFLASLGYDKLHGKQSKGKIPILILAVVLGVVLGTFLYDAYSLADMIRSGELRGFELRNIPWLISYLLRESSDYLSGTVSRVAQGLLFAGLGVFSLLRRTGKALRGDAVTELE